LSTANSAPPLKLALNVINRDLASRLVALLRQVEGLELVRPGESADALISEGPAGDASPTHLTRRESEVLELMAEGASNKSIAKRLGISVHTAKFHVRSLTDKFDAVSRTDAVIAAARKGVLQL
jgi:DNA-binding CsgD family transcriptional regulator